MHIGMQLLLPAAIDHSVSISRRQVQCIFSFSLRSRAVTSFCSWLLLNEWIQRVEHTLRKTRAGGMALQRWWFFPCRVDCTHQAALHSVCVADDHLPCALQHAKRVFSLKEHSRRCIWQTWRCVFIKTSWVLCHPCVSGCGRCLALGDGHNRCLTCLGSKHGEVAFVDESSSHCGCSPRSCGQAPWRLCFPGPPIG